VGVWDGVEVSPSRPPPAPTELRREYLLDPGVAFLNHSSFGACPVPVFERYQAWQRELEHEPIDLLDRRLQDLLDTARAARESRRDLCDLLRTEPLAPDEMIAQMAPARLPHFAPVAAYTTRDDIDRLLAALARELDAEKRQEHE
jgi:hypothetical protein